MEPPKNQPSIPNIQGDWQHDDISLKISQDKETDYIHKTDSDEKTHIFVAKNIFSSIKYLLLKNFGKDWKEIEVTEKNKTWTTNHEGELETTRKMKILVNNTWLSNISQQKDTSSLTVINKESSDTKPPDLQNQLSMQLVEPQEKELLKQELPKEELAKVYSEESTSIHTVTPKLDVPQNAEKLNELTSEKGLDAVSETTQKENLPLGQIWENTPLKVIPLETPFKFDIEVLKSVFGARLTVDFRGVRCESRFTMSSRPLNDTLFILLEGSPEEGFLFFGSSFKTKELSSEIAKIENAECQKILSDLLDVARAAKKRAWDLKQEADKSYQNLIPQIADIKIECVRTVFSNDAAPEVFSKAVVAPEHTYAIATFKEEPIHLFTTGLATCVALVVVNPEEGRVGLAHLDEGVVDTYKYSLENLFKQVQGESKHSPEIHLIGGTNFTTFTKFLDCRVSKTLVLSLINFATQRGSVIKSAFLFTDQTDTLLVTCDKQGIKFQIEFSNEFEKSLLKRRRDTHNDKKNLMWGGGIDHEELVNVSSSKWGNPVF